MSDRQCQHLKSALASAQMEDFENNETVEHDCIRLIEGEISASALVEEILNRPTKTRGSLRQKQNTTNDKKL